MRRFDLRSRRGIALAVVMNLLLAGSLAGLSSCAPAYQETRARQGLRRIFELPTVEMLFREVVYHTQSRPLDFLVGPTEALFTLPVRIQAGFDLDQGFSMERGADGGLRITLPPPKVLLADADDEGIRSLFAVPAAATLTQAQLAQLLEEASGRAVSAALELGLLERARAEARLRLQALFALWESGPIDVSFREAP